MKKNVEFRNSAMIRRYKKAKKKKSLPPPQKKNTSIVNDRYSSQFTFF